MARIQSERWIERLGVIREFGNAGSTDDSHVYGYIVSLDQD